MYVANEGRLVAFVAPAIAPRLRSRALRRVPGCEQAAEIGEVASSRPAWCSWIPRFGGRRVMDLLAGDPLPRIC